MHRQSLWFALLFVLAPLLAAQQQQQIRCEPRCAGSEICLQDTATNETIARCVGKANCGCRIGEQCVLRGEELSCECAPGYLKVGERCEPACGKDVCPVNQVCVQSPEGPACGCSLGKSPSPLDRCECRPEPLFLACRESRDCGVNQHCVRGACVCKPGFVWFENTARGTCVPHAPPPPHARAICQASGDPHFITFDNYFFDYQGTCDLVFVDSPHFKAHIRTEDCGFAGPTRNVSCCNAIAFSSPAGKVLFNDSGCFVDGAPVALPAAISGVTFDSPNGDIVAEFPDGVVVEYSRRAGCSVVLPPSFSGNVTGLCGNFDASATNDLVLRSGQPAHDEDTFAADWMVTDGDQQLFGDEGGRCVAPNVAPRSLARAASSPRGFLAPDLKCAAGTCDDFDTLLRAERKCVFQIDRECMMSTDSRRFYEACLFDFCQSDGFSNATLIDALKHRCGILEESSCHCEANETCISNRGSAECVAEEPPRCDCPAGKECAFFRDGEAVRSTCVCPRNTAVDPADPNKCVPLCDTAICGENEKCTGSPDAPWCGCAEGFHRDPVTCRCVQPLPVLSPCPERCGENQVCALREAICVCAADHVWDAPRGMCVKKDVPPIGTRGLCQVFGDPHVRTFDGIAFDFQGRCDVILLDGPLEVHGRFGECLRNFPNPEISCLTGIAFTTPSGLIAEVLQEQHPIFNNSEIAIPSTHDGVRFEEHEGELVITFPDSSVIRYGPFLASLDLPATHSGKTKGLCGNFNTLGSDDWAIPGSQDPVELTVHYEVVGRTLFDKPSPDSCLQIAAKRSSKDDVAKRAGDGTGVCGESGRVPICRDAAGFEKARDHCLSRLDKNITEICARSVDVSRYLQDCTKDVCNFGLADAEELVESTVRAILKRCEFEEKIRKERICDPPCDREHLCVAHADGRPTCEPKKDIPCDCPADKDCVVEMQNDERVVRCVCKRTFVEDANGRCVCPEGFLLNRVTFICEKEEEDGDYPVFTGCRGDGECSPNQQCQIAQNNGHCVCRHGFVLDRNTGRCVEVVPLPPRVNKQCQSMGDPHFWAFDDHYFDFQRKCDVIFVRTATVEIHTRQGECNPGFPNPNIACTRGLAFRTAAGDTAQFLMTTQNTVTAIINGNVVTAFPHSLPASSVVITHPSSSYFRASFADGLVVEYNMYYGSVTLPPAYINATEGLCGNFDGNPNDDFRRRDGVLVGDPDTFGVSWLVPAAEAIFQSTNSDCTPRRTAARAIDDVCPDTESLQDAMAACQPILELDGDYDSCGEFIDTGRFYEACVFDYCVLGGDIDTTALILQATQAQCKLILASLDNSSIAVEDLTVDFAFYTDATFTTLATLHNLADEAFVLATLKLDGEDLEESEDNAFNNTIYNVWLCVSLDGTVPSSCQQSVANEVLAIGRIWVDGSSENVNDDLEESFAPDDLPRGGRPMKTAAFNFNVQPAALVAYEHSTTAVYVEMQVLVADAADNNVLASNLKSFSLEASPSAASSLSPFRF